MRTLGGRYELEQRVGVGGMSEVWRAHDLVLDRTVAVKLISPSLDDEATSVERIRSEARSAARLVHPNVASVHDFGTSTAMPGREAPYIVMELAEGETLAAHLRAGPLDWRIAVRVCAEVSAALAAAHAHGIVHRDVKPANVILAPSGVKVLDFGIATSTGATDHTPDGIVVGTPAYLAPEQLDRQPATPAADMYALGVLLYYCLTGRLPYAASSTTQLLGARKRQAPEPLPEIDGLPAEVTDLCRRCLADDPAQRPSSLMAALLLAEVVDARVYVPMVTAAPRQRTAPVSAWTDRAAAEATEAMAVDRQPREWAS
ncbi:serine/threonine-protein kinase [Micromonospora sp. 4G57]|uniref:non-specific serine/threonine protein kinase n=1 Tax=Micromonospora sicca TaxID=2202420 RepID=A0ABU5JI04_9ACTN|nr:MULTISPECIES: serine/threonine-protein kinase [unclassified Micromonospora]MDZ5446112.1 serine/threonine-protein kinase [Micromonospora sp. 4G57]MDZ5492004.1 serine/threonine-protein kinase [Micromonospora sp. 4G53]